MESKVDSLIKGLLAEDLDAWTRRVIRRHFDAETGSPYWLKRASELDIDPRDITRYDQLVALGPFPLEELRSLDPAALVPLETRRPLAGRVWESGSTTGDPCRVFYTERMLDLRGAWRQWAMTREGFQPGLTWLQATPSGPHLIGHSGWDLVQRFDARVYCIDFDPRWVKRQLRMGRLHEAQEYTEHVVEQSISILTTQPVDYLATTPALLPTLIRRRPALVGRLRGVRMTGTHVTPAMWRSFVEVFGKNPVVIMYGNTFGNTLALPVERDGELMPHVPNYPQVTMQVVDRHDWTTVVAPGEHGQVRVTILHEDLLLPNVLERDLAMRYQSEEWPCDGVANVRPLLDVRATPEGIY